jgi:hypothetical protein
VLWNLVLDQLHEPHLGGCKDCRGVVTIDDSTSPAAFVPTVDFTALAHVSKVVRPGAYRIASSTEEESRIEHVAFATPMVRWCCSYSIQERRLSNSTSNGRASLRLIRWTPEPWRCSSSRSNPQNTTEFFDLFSAPDCAIPVSGSPLSRRNYCGLLEAARLCNSAVRSNSSLAFSISCVCL